MKGITQFVLGGLVGAALGYLVSKRRLREQIQLAPAPTHEVPIAPAEFGPESMAEPMVEPPTEAEPVIEPAVEAVAGPVVEPVIEAVGEPVVELAVEPAAEPVAEAPPEVRVTPLEELKARIEETRKRIRQELEQPFSIAGLGDKEGPAATAEQEAEPAPVSGEKSLDYDSVKSRIEAARVRLKAKAFDAMVSGETPLLARSGSQNSGEMAHQTGVDPEVEASIENALREEET